jgi:AAA family ATP:ADP antiporter
LVVVINWVNTTGGAILAEFVKLEAVRRESAGLSEAGPFIAGFFGNYNTWMTLAGFTIQAFFVSRLYRWIGVSGALLLVPAIATLGYGAMSFFPVFSLIWLVKITEDSLDYSVTNTSRQAIFLPLDQESKYQGKTTIDTFFYRFGDLLQAGAVFIGLNWFGLALVEFALLNTLLAVVWLWAAWAIGREYRRRARVASANTAPVLGRPIPEVLAPPGSRLEHVLAPDTFLDRDPGDALTFSATSPGGGPLPRWLRFRARSATFSGQVPGDHRDESTEVEVQATDFEGLSASGRFVLRHRQAAVRRRQGSDDPGEH